MNEQSRSWGELQLLPAAPGRVACFSAMTNGVVSLVFSGTAELGDPELLDGFLRRVHSQALLGRAQKVEVSFESLQFMNSSCFKAFVTWFSQLSTVRPPAAPYRVHIKLSPTKRWQRASVSALACFAPEVVSFD